MPRSLSQLAAPGLRHYLALIPGRVLPFVYTIVSSGLLETSFISVSTASHLRHSRSG